MVYQIGSLLYELAPKLVALVAAFLAMQLLLAYFRRQHRHLTFVRMQVPGPKPHLISGHLYETRRQAYVKFAHKMHEKYGETVGYFMGGDPYLMTKDLDLIKQVFVSKSRTFYDRMDFYLNVDPVPDNLICQRGDRWRYMRKLLTPAFSNGKVRNNQFYRDTQQTVDRLMGQLDANMTDSFREVFVEDSYDRMAAVALDVIVKTAFHMNDMISFEGALQTQKNYSKVANTNLNSKPDIFLGTVKRACRLGFNPIVELIFCFPFLDQPLTFLCNRLYFGGIIKLLFDRLDYLVRRHNKPTTYDSDQDVDEYKQHNSSHRRRIIDSLIEVLRDRKITKSEFRGNAFVIVFAGFETTANALTFTLWLLAKHQQVQDKLRKDIQMKLNNLKKQSTGPQNEEELLDAELSELSTGCDYLEMVINESLRLYPPVPALSCRQASENCQISNGLIIEKGVNVIPSVFSIHRDRSIWGEDANEFRPERFEMLDISQLNSAMFMPFGLGPRNCVGKSVAMHEMKIVVGRLVQHYSIESRPGRTPEKLKLCSPINITITNSEKIGLNFVELKCR